MADTLKSLVSESVQTELDTTVAKLKEMRQLITELSAGGLRMDSTSYSTQKKAIDDIINANQKLDKSQREVLDSANKLTQAQILQEKAMQESLKTEKLKQVSAAASHKAATAESKAIQDLGNDYKQLSLAYNEAALRAKNLTLVAPGSAAAKQATKEANELGNLLKKVDAEVGQHQRNVGNYSSALTGYALTLRGLRGPTKLLGEAFIGSAQAADQLRLVLEHSLQGLAAYFRHKEGKATAEATDAAATQANTVAQTEQTVATEAGTVAAEGMTVAMGEQAVATEAATAATEGLSAAIMASGIGLIIAGLVALTGLLVYQIYEWVKADEKIMEAEKKLNEAKKAMIDSRNQDMEDQKKYNEINKRKLEDELAAAEKSGQSQEKIFAIKKKINELDLVNAKVIVNNKHITEESLNKIIGKYTDAKSALNELNDQLRQSAAIEEVNATLPVGSKIPNPFGSTKDLTEKRDAQKAVFELYKADRDGQITALTDVANAKRNIDHTTNEEAKFNAEERRKIYLESAALEVDLVKTKNAVILSNEESTLDERLIALKSNAAAEKKLIEAHKNDVLNNPGSSGTDRTIAIKKAAEEEKKITIESRNTIHELILSYTKRDLAAYYAMNDAKLQAAKISNDEILQSDAFSFSQKLKAKNRELQIEFELEEDRYNQLKSRGGLTDKELEAIEAEHQTKLAQIAKKGEDDILKIKAEAQKKLTDEAKAYNDGYIARLQANEANQLAELNRLYADGAISLDKYNDAKQKLQNEGSVKVLRAEISALETELKATDDLNKKEQIRAQIAKKNEQITEIDVSNKNKSVEDKKKAIDKDVHYEEEGAKLVGAIVDGGFEQKKNAIQHEIDLIETRKEADINAINNSTLNAQQKAAQMMIVEQKAAAQKEKLQRDQRNEEIRKAKFDKEAAALQVVINTAAAIAKSVAESPLTGGMPFAAVAAVEGAVQLATILARPIPKYAVGTDYAPGGPAIVGEEGVEMRISPSGQVSFTPDHASLVNTQKGERIIPNDLTMQLLARSLSMPDVEKQDNGMDLQIVMALREVKEAIKKQKAPNVSFKSTGDWNAYIEKEVRN